MCLRSSGLKYVALKARAVLRRFSTCVLSVVCLHFIAALVISCMLTNWPMYFSRPPGILASLMRWANQ